MTPDGGLEMRVGVHSHGQGLETTLAQVAHEILGIDIDEDACRAWRYRHHALFDGHLGLALAWSWPAARLALPALKSAERAKRNRRQLLQLDPAAVTLRDGSACADPAAASASAEIAHAWYLRPQDLPPDVDPRRPRGNQSATSRGATAAPSVMRPHAAVGRGRSRASAMSRSSTTSSSRTAACWSIP